MERLVQEAISVQLKDDRTIIGSQHRNWVLSEKKPFLFSHEIMNLFKETSVRFL